MALETDCWEAKHAKISYKTLCPLALAPRPTVCPTRRAGLPLGDTQPDNGRATMGRGQWLTLERDAMPTVTIRYRLPEEQAEYDAARLGRAMAATLWEIDQRCRSLVKHGEPSSETGQLAEEIRQMIRLGCPEALEL